MKGEQISGRARSHRAAVSATTRSTDRPEGRADRPRPWPTPTMLRAMPIALGDLAARVPRRWRRRVPMRLRNALVERFGHPTEPFDPLAHPRRLNLGAGFDNRPGYLNVDLNDFHGPDLVGDARSFPSCRRPLRGGHRAGCARTSRAGGRPESACRVATVAGPRADGCGCGSPTCRRSCAGWRQDETAERHRQIMHFMFGTQAYNGDFHLAGYTDVLALRRTDAGAGWRRPQLELRDDWLWEGTRSPPTE